MEKVSIMCLTIFVIFMFVDCVWGMCRFRASVGSALCTSFPEVLSAGWQRAPVTMALGDSSGRVQAVLDEIRKYNERVQQYNAQTAAGHGWVDSSTTL